MTPQIAQLALAAIFYIAACYLVIRLFRDHPITTRREAIFASYAAFGLLLAVAVTADRWAGQSAPIILKAAGMAALFYFTTAWLAFIVAYAKLEFLEIRERRQRRVSA